MSTTFVKDLHYQKQDIRWEFDLPAGTKGTNHDSEMMGIKTAEIKKVKFFDEDIEKMKNMTQEERLEYKSKLKDEHRYTYDEE